MKKPFRAHKCVDGSTPITFEIARGEHIRVAETFGNDAEQLAQIIANMLNAEAPRRGSKARFEQFYESVKAACVRHANGPKELAMAAHALIGFAAASLFNANCGDVLCGAVNDHLTKL